MIMTSSIDNASSAPPDGLLGGALLSLVGIGLAWFALARWRSGWGDGGVRLRERGAAGAIFVQLGFAMFPWLVALSGMFGIFAFTGLFVMSGWDIFGFLGVGSAVVCLASGIWGVKEFYRPSRRRRWPEWIAEFDKAAGITR